MKKISYVIHFFSWLAGWCFILFFLFFSFLFCLEYIWKSIIYSFNPNSIWRLSVCCCCCCFFSNSNHSFIQSSHWITVQCVVQEISIHFIQIKSNHLVQNSTTVTILQKNFRIIFFSLQYTENKISENKGLILLLSVNGDGGPVSEWVILHFFFV